VDSEVVAGYDDGNYHPEWAVDRAQMAVYVSRALAEGEENVPEPTTDPGFTDVDSEHWAYKHICYAVDQNVVQGYPEGDYKPDIEVTRDQMAVYMARAMVAPSASVLDSYVPADPQDFPDVPSDHWAYKYVEYCVEEGVVSGYPEGDYKPDEVVTRDQMSVYIARAFALDLAIPTYDITEHFPLEIGDTWTCRDNESDTWTREVSGTAEIFGETCMVIEDTEGDSGDAWISAPEGLYYAGTADEGVEITFNPAIYFPNHVAVGDSGSSNTLVYVDGVPVGAGTVDWELAAVEDVTVTAGTFEDSLKMAVTLDVPGEYSEVHIWFARDVGMVKFDSLTDAEEWEMISGTVGGTVYP